MEHRNLLYGSFFFITLAVLALVFKLTSSLLIPLFIALMISFIVSPVINLLHRWHIPRIIAILVVIMLLLGGLVLIFFFLYNSFNSFVAEYAKYEARFKTIYSTMFNYVQNRWSISLDDVVFSFDWGDQLKSFVFSLSGSFVVFFRQTFIMVFFLIFLLIEQPYMERKIHLAFDRAASRTMVDVFDNINLEIGKYLTVKLLISLITGFLVWITLTLFGVDFALIWGTLAVIFNFIPNIGSLMIMVITIGMGVIQYFPSLPYMIGIAISMIAIQLIMGNIIDPRMQGKRLNLSPLLILVSLLFWGYLWGIVGMFLAVPLMVSIKIVCENIPYLRPISIMMGMGNRPDLEERIQVEPSSDPPANDSLGGEPGE